MKRLIRADFAVLGAGSGGLSVAAGAAQLGRKVVLFEHAEMGGDCLNVGCVPSKALLAAAHAARGVRDAARFGVRAGEPEIDFAAVMAHVRRAIAAIAPHDSQERFEGLGVTVVRERAAFADRRTVESSSLRVEARRIVIATGSRPAVPPIPGLDAVPYLTNESVWSLEELPRRLLVLGGGPIGVELGQAFARLGSDMVILEAASDLLAREDPDLRRPVLDSLAADGVALRAGARAERVEGSTAGVTVTLEGGERLDGSHLLVATGRTPAVEGLNLEAAGIACDKQGVRVDASLRTTNRRVFAVGDVAGGAFTHVAGAHASLVIRKTLFAAPVDAGKLVVPRVTYTDPPLAAVGLTEAEARAKHGDSVRVLASPFAKNDRAQAEAEPEGFAKLIATRGGKVLGVGIVGAGADELIHAWVLALSHGLKLRQLASGWIPPYPTRGDINRALGSAWYAPVLFSPRTRRLVSLLTRLS